MGLQQTSIESLPFCDRRTELSGADAGKKPRKPMRSIRRQASRSPRHCLKPHHVSDLRRALDRKHAFRWIAKGFALVKHPTIVRNFYDDKEVRSVYYPAAEAFLRATLKGRSRSHLRPHRSQSGWKARPISAAPGPRQAGERAFMSIRTDISGRNPRAAEPLAR